MVKIFTAFFKKKLIRSFFCFFAVLFSAQAQYSFITVLDTTSLAVTAQDMIDFHAKGSTEVRTIISLYNSLDRKILS